MLSGNLVDGFCTIRCSSLKTLRQRATPDTQSPNHAWMVWPLSLSPSSAIVRTAPVSQSIHPHTPQPQSHRTTIGPGNDNAPGSSRSRRENSTRMAVNARCATRKSDQPRTRAKPSVSHFREQSAMKRVKNISHRPLGLVDGRYRCRCAQVRRYSVCIVSATPRMRRSLADRFNELILIHVHRPNTKLRPAVSHPPILCISTARSAQTMLVVTPALGVSPRLLAPEIAVISACSPTPVIGVKPSFRAIAICAAERSVPPPATSVGPSAVSRRDIVLRKYIG